MTKLSTDGPRIRRTIARGVDIHVVMVDPEWILGSRDIAGIYDDFYRQEGIAKSFQAAHARLTDLADEINSGSKSQLRVHIYRSVITQSATIADPGTSAAFGQLELHTYGHQMDRIRTTLPGIDGQALLLAQCLRTVSNLVGYDFTNDTRHGGMPNPLFSLA